MLNHLTPDLFSTVVAAVRGRPTISVPVSTISLFSRVMFPTFRPRRSCAVRSSAVTEQRLLRSPDRSQHNTLNFWWRGGGAPGGKESGAAADQRGAALLPPGCVVRFSAPAGTLLIVLFWPDQQRKMGEADYTGSSRPVVHSGHPHQKICLGCFPKENIFCFT